MKKVIIKSEGINHSAIDVGEWDKLSEYSYLHPKLRKEIRGKLFVGKYLKSTGVEISLQVLPANTEIPFLHSHNTHEEVYLFIKGNGSFKVDEAVFDVTEGSIVRVATKGRRTWKNNSSCSMIFFVIQAKENSLKDYCVVDGYRVSGDVLSEE